jgi:hypothetical protein
VGDLIAGAVKTPAAQQLRERVEAGGVLSLEGVSLAAYPYLAAWVHWLVPERPLVAVVDLLKTQESVHQDLCTWLTGVAPTGRSTATRCAEPLFYPAWDVWPHESRLPHADVISERLETLLALGGMDAAESRSGAAPVVVTTAVALQQRTFSPSALKKRTRLLRAGDHCDPLELVAWLESQAYEPEAQVTQKGELALRGGILDIFPLSSRWPVRLEFFGNQLESLRLFDPLTQLSREATDGVVLPPAGELALLRRLAAERPGELGSLVDYLDGRAVVLLFDLPELVMQARRYAEGARTVAPLFVEWENALSSMRAQGARSGGGHRLGDLRTVSCPAAAPAPVPARRRHAIGARDRFHRARGRRLCCSLAARSSAGIWELQRGRPARPGVSAWPPNPPRRGRNAWCSSLRWIPTKRPSSTSRSPVSLGEQIRGRRQGPSRSTPWRRPLGQDAQAHSAVQDLAAELLGLQATRGQDRHAFPPIRPGNASSRRVSL